MNLARSICLLTLALSGMGSLAQAKTENCQTKTLKSLDEVADMLMASGPGQVYVVESAYYPSTLKYMSKDKNGQVTQRYFSSESIKKDSGVWKRLPEFDYDDSNPSINLSCGYGSINYKLAFQVGDSALCYMHNPKGSVLDRKGKLVACLVVPADIESLLNHVKEDFKEKFSN